jgi:BirA family biotin operon repressor/biotin-[acetyl-CoA-carboxylase] ligase
MSIRDKLLQGFDGGLGQVVSGEALSRRLGVSRTAVWKQLLALKNAGFPIESAGRQGYRLGAPFDPSLIEFRGPAWVVPHYYMTTASTQTLGKAGAAAGLPEGHLWTAEMQTQGRGRLDRAWASGYGGLWFSLLLRPKLPPGRIPPLTLVAGLSLRQAVFDICRVEAKLKWPNDLLVLSSRGTYRKLAGILTEMSGPMERTEWVVIGVGINVHNALPADLAGRAASLYGVTGKTWSRARILEGFLKRFKDNYQRYSEEGFAPFVRPYWKSYFAPDRAVRLKTAGGLVSGIARGVDVGGGLMIESRRKIATSYEGEIIL